VKFDRQLWPATETSWVVSYGKKNSKMADGHFENRYRHISAKIIRFSWNFVHSSRL